MAENVPRRARETVSAAPESHGNRRDGAVEVKRGLLDFDLNVAPPEESDSESPRAESAQEIRSMAAADGSKSSANRGAIGAHSSRGKGKEEEEGNARCWDALLEAANGALREYEASARGEEEKARNRRRRPSREAEQREAEEARARKKVDYDDGGGFAERWSDAAAAPVVVARSTRRRAVAMPSKYKDSVLHAAAVVVAEARCSRRRSG